MLDRYSTELESTKSPLFFWRAKAGKLERRWRERTCTVSGPRATPENPADAQDDAVQADVDAELKIAFEDIRSFFPVQHPVTVRNNPGPNSREKAK